jgi:hypothetical protein
MTPNADYALVPSAHGKGLLLAVAIRQLHAERRFNGDGYGWSVCVECRQAWPCATEQAVRSVETIPPNDRSEP